MDNIKLAQNIKKICKEKRITISELLETCRLNKNFIYFMEKKNVSPNIDSLYKIADLLNIDISLLFNENYNQNQLKMFELFNILDEKYQNEAISQVFKLVVKMSNEQDEELNSKKAYISALGGGVMQIDEDLAKYIEENIVVDEYKPNNKF